MMIIDLDRLSGVVWRKSSHSTAGNQCVEVGRAYSADGVHLVRDSKNPDHGAVAIGSAEWTAFLARIKSGDFAL